ncbi:hypothetical protein E1287_19760 [Actinomadura sp. KC06]|uniref:hypothetical protein n=1 Tax=Actinomadura sp. KC06 TaxID=2530369 RepID=UPI00104ECF2B|nr:hypothetical protein [Actinomadura sp. KC06]TDD33307.1 hypothetical protein E1287_19760 [Actinomadura sp. KC06]
MDGTNSTSDGRAGEGAEAAVHAAESALRAAGLALSADEIVRLASGYDVLRAKADALSALALRDDPPIDPVAMAQTSALPGEGARP